MNRILHSVAANPWIYDKVQLMAGARHVHRRIAGQIGCLRPDCLVLDVGGAGAVSGACGLTPAPTCV